MPKNKVFPYLLGVLALVVWWIWALGTRDKAHFLDAHSHILHWKKYFLSRVSDVPAVRISCVCLLLQSFVISCHYHPLWKKKDPLSLPAKSSISRLLSFSILFFFFFAADDDDDDCSDHLAFLVATLHCRQTDLLLQKSWLTDWLAKRWMKI